MSVTVEIKKQHVNYLLGLTFLGMLLVAMGWEFVLEDLVVPVFHTHHEPEPSFERWEYVVTSITFFSIALFIPAWMARRAVEQSDHSREAMNRLNEELALRVEQRTAELTAANGQLKNALQELRHSEQALRKSDNELRYLSALLLIAQEDERQRVSRDLYDHVSQLLSALKFKVEYLLVETDPRSKEAAAGALVGLLQEALEEVRNIYMDLRPSLLDDIGLIATVNWFCRKFRQRFPGIQVQVTIDVTETEIPDGLKIVLFRVMEEALNNVARHSCSDRADISLRKNNEVIEFSVQDHGIGFRLNGALPLQRSGKGIGLISMKERVELAGGHLEIHTSKGAGTLLRVSYVVGESGET